MKSDLKRIATTVRERLIAGHPPDAVKTYRDREIAKLMKVRKETYEKTIADLDTGIQEIRAQFDPVIEDNAASLARHLRISDQWSMYPSNKLKAVDLKTINHLDLPAFAATCRKRGLHELADSAYVAYENQRNAWKLSPYVQKLQNMRNKLETLHMNDPHSFWVGDTIDTIDKSDFGEILEGGQIRFRDGDEVITV